MKAAIVIDTSKEIPHKWLEYYNIFPIDSFCFQFWDCVFYCCKNTKITATRAPSNFGVGFKVFHIIPTPP